jgi:hypothetical protein
VLTGATQEAITSTWLTNLSSNGRSRNQSRRAFIHQGEGRRMSESEANERRRMSKSLLQFGCARRKEANESSAADPESRGRCVQKMR